MSNIDTVQSIYAAFGTGNIPHILNTVSEDVDWTFFGPSAIPFAGHYQGRAELGHFFTQVGQNAEVQQYDVRELEAAGDNVIVQGWQRVKARPTGKVWETHFIHVYWFENGQPVKIREYYDTAPMVAAFTA